MRACYEDFLKTDDYGENAVEIMNNNNDHSSDLLVGESSSDFPASEIGETDR